MEPTILKEVRVGIFSTFFFKFQRVKGWSNIIKKNKNQPPVRVTFYRAHMCFCFPRCYRGNVQRSREHFDFYDLQLFNPPVGGHKWFRIKMPMVQGDAKTQIVLFLPCDRGPTPLLGDKNDEKSRFFQKYPHSEDL